MGLHWLDLALFVAFFAVVVGVSMYKSRRERSGEDFFLAGRSLVKPLKSPKVLPARADIDLNSTPLLKWLCAVVIGLTLALYAVFW